MAPTPTSRRSKQAPSSSPSPNILPGIAIGIFAAVAAGFAASRTLSRKRRLQSTKDEEHAPTGDSLPVHEREIEINARNGPEFTANGIVTRAIDSAGLSDDLELAVDVMKAVTCSTKGSAERRHEDDEEIKEVVNAHISSRTVSNDGVEKIAEIVGKEDVCSKDKEITELAVGDEASFISNEVLVDALQRMHNEEGEEEDCVMIIDNEDTGEDGDDDRSSTGQPPSPILINGRIFDFFEEMSDLKNMPDLSANVGICLSDSVSECSMQEVSSAPVKPFVLADDALEASWMLSKPDFVGASDKFVQEEVMVEKKNRPVERNSLILEDDLSTTERESYEMEEKKVHAEKEVFHLEEGLAASIDELDVVTDVLDVVNDVPVLIKLDGEDLSFNNIHEIDVENDSHCCVALEGELSDKLTEACTDCARINDKVLSDATLFGGCNHSGTTSTEQVLQAANENVDGSLGLTLKYEINAEPACINGTIFSEKSHDQPNSHDGVVTSILRPILQPAVEDAACKGSFETLTETEVQPTIGPPFDIADADIKVELLVGSTQDTAGLGIGKNGLQSTRGNEVNDNLSAMCDNSEVTSFSKTEEEKIGVVMEIEDSTVEPIAESSYDMAGVGRDSLEEHYAEEFAKLTSDAVDNSEATCPNSDATCDGSKMTSFCMSVNNLVENSEVKPNSASTQVMPGVGSDSLEEHNAEEPPKQFLGGCDSRSVLAKEGNVAGLTELATVFASNFAAKSELEPNADLKQETTCLENGALEDDLLGEEPGMQAGRHNCTISKVTVNHNSGSMCGGTDLEETLQKPTNHLAVQEKVKPSADPREEMTCLDRGFLKGSVYAEDPEMQAGGHDAAMPSFTTDDHSLEYAEDPGTQAGRHGAVIFNVTTDDIKDNTHGTKDLDSAETVEDFTEHPGVDSELLLKSMRGITSTEIGASRLFAGDELAMESGGHAVDPCISGVTHDVVENNAEEQPRFSLLPLEDGVERDDLILGASPDKVEMSASRKEDYSAESAVAYYKINAKEQEIEEILRADDAIDDRLETAPVAQSQYASHDKSREIDELFTTEAYSLQSRSRFSSKGLRYLSMQIVLLCLLIASVSFILQCLEVPSSTLPNGSP